MFTNDPAERERLNRRRDEGRRLMSRQTGLLLTGFGAFLVLLGVAQQDTFTRLFTGGRLLLNDAVPGTVMLAVGLPLLRFAGRAPLCQQVRAICHWGNDRWVSLGLTATGLLAGLGVAFVGVLLRSSPWLHYGFLGLATAFVVIGAWLWPRPRNGSAQG